MRVVVFGGRDWTDTEFVYKSLDRLHRQYGFDVVIEGDARGIDRMAGFWARQKRIDNVKYRAEWEKEGAAAGPKRNQRMIDEGRPEMGIAFPGGRGTADMRRRVVAAGLPVVDVKP